MHAKPFDFNLHILSGADSERHLWLTEECCHSVFSFGESYRSVRHQLLQSLSGANFMLFNQEFPFIDCDLCSLVDNIRFDFPVSTFTQLLDFRHPLLEQGLLNLKASGVQGVKFHSYVQKIRNSDIQSAVEAAQLAASLGFFVCIDASYGTTWMYDFDNMLLAANVLRAVRDVPVILLHSGGVRRWDAMLLALDAPNLYLETSFTLPYYEGSSIESDLAFVYRKIGCERVLYASDFPYVSLESSLECSKRFFERHRFGIDEVNAVSLKNALRLISQLMP